MDTLSYKTTVDWNPFVGGVQVRLDVASPQAVHNGLTWLDTILDRLIVAVATLVPAVLALLCDFEKLVSISLAFSRQ